MTAAQTIILDGEAAINTAYYQGEAEYIAVPAHIYVSAYSSLSLRH